MPSEQLHSQGRGAGAGALEAASAQVSAPARRGGQVGALPARSSGRMESWTFPAHPGAGPVEETPAGLPADDVAGLSGSPAFWRGPPPLSDSLVLPAGLADMGHVFCWRDDLDCCISYLNKELGALGLPALFKDDGCGAEAEHGFNLLALVNGTCGLLNLYQSISTKLGDMEAEGIRRAEELDHLRARQTKLKDQVETCEREIVAVQAKARQLQSKNEQLNGLLRGEKDEITTLSNTLASRTAQHLHEMKRKEQDLSRLKEKMSQLVTEKKDRRGTIEILNTLTRPDGKRPTWKTGKSLGKREEELFRVQLARQEQREQGLARENARLKELLTQVGQDVQQWMGSEGSITQGAEENFPHEGFREQWCQFRDVVGASGSCMPRRGERDPVISITDHDKEMVRLKKQIEQSRALISLQRRGFQEQLDNLVTVELPSPLKGSYFLEEELRLEEERAVFEEQRRTFATERRNFTEAAIRLGWEKKQFEEEKALLLRQEFLRSLPRLKIRDPNRRLSAPVVAGEHDHLHRQRWRSRPVSTPFPKVVVTPSGSPVALFRTQSWQCASDPSTPARAEVYWPTARLPSHGPVSSLWLSQRKADRQDTACQTELAVEDEFDGDLLDWSSESSLLGCHVIGIQEYL